MEYGYEGMISYTTFVDNSYSCGYSILRLKKYKSYSNQGIAALFQDGPIKRCVKHLGPVNRLLLMK